MHFVDDDHGWVVGNTGTIIRTVDGGEAWKSFGDSNWGYLLDVSFLNRQQGWIAGGSRVLFTADGGLTWRSEWQNEPMSQDPSFSAVQVLNSRDRLAFSHSGTLLRSGEPYDSAPFLSSFQTAKDHSKLLWRAQDDQDGSEIICSLEFRKSTWPPDKWESIQTDIVPISVSRRNANFEIEWRPQDFIGTSGRIQFRVLLSDKANENVVQEINRVYRLGPRPWQEQLALGAILILAGNIALVLLAGRVQWIRAVMMHPSGRAVVGLVFGKYLVTDWMIRFIKPLKLGLFRSYRKNLANSAIARLWTANVYIPPEIRTGQDKLDPEAGNSTWSSVLGQLLTEPRPKIWVLEGESGLGKTALLENWTLKALDYGETPVLVRLGSNLLAEEEVAAVFSQFGEVNVSASEALDLITGGGFVILLDGFNEDPNPEATREFVRKAYKRNLVVVTSQFTPRWATHLGAGDLALMPFGKEQLESLLGSTWTQHVMDATHLKEAVRLPVTSVLIADFIRKRGRLPDHATSVYEAFRQNLRQEASGIEVLNLDYTSWQLFLGNILEFGADESMPTQFCEHAVREGVLTVRIQQDQERRYRFSHERIRDYFAAKFLSRQDIRTWEDLFAEAEERKKGLGRRRWGGIVGFFGESLVQQDTAAGATAAYEKFAQEIGDNFDARVFAQVIFPQYERFVASGIIQENSVFVKWAARTLQRAATWSVV